MGDKALTRHLVGGYDDGYASCDCFWGTRPGRLVRQLERHLPSFQGMRVVDAGCGEGKNSYWLADRGAKVLGIDVSQLALSTATSRDSNATNIQFLQSDFLEVQLSDSFFDIAIAYGLFHCLSSRTRVIAACRRLKAITSPGGYLVICTFNNRRPVDRRAHPFLNACLLPHSLYVNEFQDYHLLHNSDEDLTETHPNNGIRHTHAMTRLLVKRPE